MMKYGNKYKYYQPFKKNHGVFKGKFIKPNILVSLLEGYLLKRNFRHIKHFIENIYIYFLNLYFFRKLKI